MRRPLQDSSVTSNSVPTKSELPQPKVSLLWKTKLVWSGVVAFICLSGMLAYGLPDNPLDSWPWARNFTDFAARLIPGIDQLAGVSEMPQVTRVFMSILWVVWGPIAFVLILIFGHVTKESVVMAMRAVRASWWSFLLAPPIMATIAWFLFAMPDLANESSVSLLRWMAESMGRSRFWLGICGSAIVFTAAFALAACLKSFYLVRLAYIMRASSPVYGKEPK